LPVVHAREQFGYPLNVAAHVPQFCVESNPYGHMLHVLLYHRLMHVQLQPVLMLPVTFAAWLLQLAKIVHDL
jgi:hypothetical protein